MDHLHEVEVFRSMLFQKGVCSLDIDLKEDVLADLLCSDERAVYHFYDTYFDQPKGEEEKARRMAYSALERNDMLSKDLILLSLYAQWLDSLRLAFGIGHARDKIREVGFVAWRRFDTQVIRFCVSHARSKAVASVSAPRKTCYFLQSKSTRQLEKDRNILREAGLL